MTKKRTFKTKSFAKWMRKTELKDQDLLIAVTEMEAGLIDADLGGNVFKKRVALQRMKKIILMMMSWFIYKALHIDC